MYRSSNRNMHPNWKGYVDKHNYVNEGVFNPLTPNDPYSGRTAPLTSKRYILYIHSTNIDTEYFKQSIISPFFYSKCSLFHISNVCVSCIIHILYTGCAKIFKNNSGSKRLMAILDNYMFWPLLAIFRLSSRELKVLLYTLSARTWCRYLYIRTLLRNVISTCGGMLWLEA